MDDASLLRAQRNEITEHRIYSRLSSMPRNARNRRVLRRIAADEKRHYEVFRRLTGRELRPCRRRVRWYVFLSRLFGVSFSLRLMERGESLAQEAYRSSRERSVRELWREEQRHERELLGLLADERVEYAGSIVLGLNDALVELSGALAGLSLALRDTRVIALIGAVTGFAASLSMAASGFLSAREEGDGGKSPLKSAAYTGIAYVLVVVLLILPYLLLESHVAALAIMLATTVVVIAGYTFYVTVAKGLRFWPRFLEMAAISLGVSVLSFGVGVLLRSLFGIGG